MSEPKSIGAMNLLNDNYGNLFTIAKKYVTGELSRLEMISADELLNEEMIERALTGIQRPGTKAQAERGLQAHQARTGHNRGEIRYLGHKARGWR